MADGKPGAAVDVNQDSYHNLHLKPIVLELAALSKVGRGFHGIVFDTEIYASDKAVQPERSYDIGITSPFVRHIRRSSIFNKTINKHYSPNTLEQSEAYNLLKRGLTIKYQSLKDQADSINPLLQYGLYMQPSNKDWFRIPLGRSFADPQRPLLLFAIESYGHNIDELGMGTSFIPLEPSAYYSEMFDAPIVYVPGFLLRLYPPLSLSKNIESLESLNIFNYWIYRISDFDRPRDKSGLHASREDYINAFDQSNLRFEK